MNSSPVRSFICIQLPPNVRAALIDALIPLRRKFPSLMWVRQEALHLTIKFCGECQAPLLVQFASAVGNALFSSRCSSFTLSCGEFGGFSNLNRMRTLFLHIKGDTDVLAALASLVEQAAKASGIPENKRPFRPHITLARSRSPKRISGELFTLPFLEWTVEGVTFMKSTLSAHGPEYTVLKYWDLC